MDAPTGNERFSASTRGQIVALLRRAARTVNELAAALGLTDNAVRAHLATLERDGLVAQAGLRRGASKPSYAYQLTAAGEELFPKAYDATLCALLAELAERLPPDALEEALRATGARLAEGRVASGEPAERVAQAARLLAELGGLPEIEPQAAGWLIRGYSCPLAAVVRAHPAACVLAEQLLADVTGLPVREQCAHGDPPRCCFAIGAPRSSS
jgi:predicted ArsR family transcriptional regulator